MNKINKCLFPVAGYGTRFLPATKVIAYKFQGERFDCVSVKGFVVNDNTILQETILHLNGPNNLVGYRFLAVDL